MSVGESINQKLATLSALSRSQQRNVAIGLLDDEQRRAYFLAHPHDAERVRRAMETRRRRAGLDSQDPEPQAFDQWPTT